MKKKILFVTGTRADFGKIKSLIASVHASTQFEEYVYVCGMHLLDKFGATYEEVLKEKYKNIFVAYDSIVSENMSINLSEVTKSLTGYVLRVKPDMIVVHGDRTDALAGAIVGALNNIKVAHIEGGELSGTIDESIRHAISKFAHFHFVCNAEAKKRLIQLGEEESRIYVIGSPDIDIMMSDALPSLESARKRYGIGFGNYGILMYHPVTTETALLKNNIANVVSAVLESGKNMIVIYPNNDSGCQIILNEYSRFEGKKNIKVFPSLRFEYFLVLLKNAEFIMGNSSAGIRESGIYGVPSIDLGTRQSGRYSVTVADNIQHVNEVKKDVLFAISETDKFKKSSFIFGEGNSTEKFMSVINESEFWNKEIQKHFVDRGI